MIEARSKLDGLPHQMDLWTDTTDDARLAIVGPYGCGKTMALAVKALLMAQDNQGIDSMLVIPTYSMFRLVHLGEWPTIWKNLNIEVTWRPGDSAWLWPWGSKLWVRSAENPARLAGPNLHAVLFDEPGQMDRAAWDRGSIRARHPESSYRQVVLGGTPEGLNWFADVFDDPKPPNRIIRAKGWHPSMAHAEGQIRDTYGYDDSLMAAYGRGEFVPLRQGRCYRHFKRATHVVPEIPIERALPLVLSCDFNVDTMRWIVMQFGADRIDMIDEIKLGTSGTTEEAAREFVNRYQNQYRGQVIVTGDPAGKARSTGGRIDYQIIQEELGACPAVTSVEMAVPGSHPLQKERVDNMNYHLSGRGLTVRISEKCSDLIRDFERVAWKQGQTVSIQKNDASLTHSSDAATYAVWALARAVGNVEIHTHDSADSMFSSEDPILSQEW